MGDMLWSTHRQGDPSTTTRTPSVKRALLTQRSPGSLDEGGRGLLILDAASSAWGVTQIPDDGKYEWFRIATTRSSLQESAPFRREM